MKILSLFDGVSCARLAIEKNNIPIETYYASEVDKYAIKVTQGNKPDTIQLYDVRFVTKDKVGEIDLLIGGSPCQDLSIAKKDRKGLSGERSGLFWEYVRIYGMSNQDPKQMYGASVFLNKGDKNIVPYYDILYANQNFEP